VFYDKKWGLLQNQGETGGEHGVVKRALYKEGEQPNKNAVLIGRGKRGGEKPCDVGKKQKMGVHEGLHPWGFSN